MEITLRFLGVLRGIMGKGRVQLKLENSHVSLNDVMNKIVSRNPNLERTLIDADLKDPRPSTLILVNGKEISVLNGLETPVKEGDELVFISVSHGG